MNFTHAHKRCRRRRVTVGAIGHSRSGSRIYLDIGTVIMAMTIKVAAMTGLAVDPGNTLLAGGTADQCASGIAVAGQAARLIMNLTCGHIGCRGGIGMTAHAQGHRIHGVCMAMSIKV